MTIAPSLRRDRLLRRRIQITAACAICRRCCTESITAGCCARKASPSCSVHCRLPSIIASTCGKATSDLTLGIPRLLRPAPAASCAALERGVLRILQPAMRLDHFQRISGGHQDLRQSADRDKARSAPAIDPVALACSRVLLLLGTGGTVCSASLMPGGGSGITVCAGPQAARGPRGRQAKSGCAIVNDIKRPWPRRPEPSRS